MSNTVVIIEDEANIAESLTFILEQAGFNVDTRNDGALALNRIQYLKPDFVILDIMLPNRSGFDILKDIRNIEEFKTMPVMILSAKGQARDREMAIELGATVYITKPFSNAEIVKTVKHYTKHEN